MQKAQTLAQLSKPAYQPLQFKPVVPSKKRPEEILQLGKRMALDGTEITVYNQSLYEPSISSQSQGGGNRKVHRFGKSRRQMKLNFASSSQRSNMLEPMSDAGSDDEGKPPIRNSQEPQQMGEDDSDGERVHSGSEMMQFEQPAN